MTNSERKDDDDAECGSDGELGSDDKGELVCGSSDGGGGERGEEVGSAAPSAGVDIEDGVAGICAGCVS